MGTELGKPRCRRCGNLLIKYHNATVPICPLCDTGDGGVRGETNNGGTFGNMSKTQATFCKTRNAQCAEYGGDLHNLDGHIHACADMVGGMRNLTAEQEFAFGHLFNMANIARYYICVQLKETADILRDAGLIKEGDDPWNLGRGHQ